MQFPILGGFNFMNCWATGYIAGSNAAFHALHTSNSTWIFL